MTLHFAQQQFFSAIRDGILSEEPLRNRFEKIYSRTIDKIGADPCLTEALSQRISTMRSARPGLDHLAENDVRELLIEIVAIFDALEAAYYGPCFERIARSND